MFYLVMLVSCDVWLSLLTRKYPEDQKSETNLLIYASFVGASFIFLIIRAFGFFMVSLRCSERLHDKMVAAVLQAPVVFFDLNSVGRIMNRFFKDIGCMDEVLPKKFLRAVQRTFSGRLRPGSKSFMIFMYSFQKLWLKTSTRDDFLVR